MFSLFLLCPRCRSASCVGCLLVLMLAVLPAWTAGSTVLSFEAALQQATERAPLLMARDAQITAAREDAGRAAALPDPKLILGVSNWPVTGSDAFDLRADEMTTQEIGLMQEFPAHAKRQARQAVADAVLAQAHATALADVRAVRQAVAAAWVGLWAAQRERIALEGMRDPVNAAQRAARARLTGGTGTATDVLAVEVAGLALDNRLDAANAVIGAARASLARWLGSMGDSVRAEGGAPDLMTLPQPETALLTQMDAQAPLLPWASRLTMAEAQVNAALAEKRLDWSLSLTYGKRDRGRDGMPRSDMLMIEVGIGLPIFTRGRQNHAVAARRAELRAVTAELEDARRIQGETVQRTLAQWHGLRRRITRQQEQILPVARDRSATALAAYAAGGDLQPWLEARRDEIELRIEHARLWGELGQAWAALAYLLPNRENVP